MGAKQSDGGDMPIQQHSKNELPLVQILVAKFTSALSSPA